MARATSLVLGAVVLAAVTHAAADEVAQLRVAASAPEGSTVAQALATWTAGVQTRTALHVALHVGSTDGDEQILAKQLEHEQLDAMVVTTATLGKLAPDLRALALPLYFRDRNELYEVEKRLEDELVARLVKTDVVRLAWVGNDPVHLFARGLGNDLHGKKHGAWDADPIANALLTALGSTGQPLPLVEILLRVKEGRLDLIAHPIAAGVALALPERLPNVSAVAIAYQPSVLVVRRSVWASLDEPTQRALRDESQKLERALTQAAAAADHQALDTVKQRRAVFSPSLTKRLARAAHEIALAGDDKWYAASLRARIDQILVDLRRVRPKR